LRQTRGITACEPYSSTGIALNIGVEHPWRPLARTQPL
jgi:hypothetical protein